ncbi:MAG: 50S ribosomal protein L31 [Pseudomonadota bacterium]
MRENIHPQSKEISVTCACGNVVKTVSTLQDSFSVEICSACHPFFTGKQKLIDSAGKVERFKKKYEKFNAANAQKK